LALPRYACIDLTSGAVSELPSSEDYFRLYLGGKALATRLLLDLTPPGLDPLSPEAVIIVNTGPLNGSGAPSASRFNMSFKNVLTGGIASTNCGGNFGFALRKAGYDGLVIKGAAASPTLIAIDDGAIELRDATELWGLTLSEAQAHFERGQEPFLIGPAGENQVYYAGVASGERIAGRCGGGAVFGAKKLKGLVASGKQPIPVFDKEKFKAFNAKWIKFLRSHPMTGEALPRYGSGGLVNKANASDALPTHNFQAGHYADADKFSGETLAETLLVKNSGCTSCPIRCERRVKSGENEIKGPEYETLGLFGASLEVDQLDAIIEINRVCDELGMDTISAAGTLAFAMELGEKGVRDFGVHSGDAEGILALLHKIAQREGVGDELAYGSKWLAEKYGGVEYAIHAKGLELASYEPRRSVGMGLGYATSNRGGCHLGGGYTALLESVGVLSLKPQSPHAKAQWTILMQNALDAISSGGNCLFSAQTFVPAVLYHLGPNHWVTRLAGNILTYTGWAITGLLHANGLLRFNTLYLFPHAESLRLATGINIKTGDFFALGDRCFNLERFYNLREGLTAADDTLPDRLLKDPQDPDNPRTVVPLEQMLGVYYRVRGWGKDGVPKPKKLRKLGLGDLLKPKVTHNAAIGAE
jgi:aldehyde:ferredoxin oxidoreductase